MRPVTLRDVAEAANVSTAAVSKVLHGSGASIRVSQERAELIREAASRLNYRPNVLARSLRKSKTHTIGVLFENLKGLSDGPMYISNLLDGVASVCFRNHYRLTVLAEIDHHNVIGSLRDGQLDGIIWCKLANDEEVLRELQSSPIPVVALNASVPDSIVKITHVNCDNRGGIELAVRHLVELDHRKIAFAYEVEERATPDLVARKSAFEEVMHEHGLEAATVEWNWNLEGLPEHLANVGFTAVVCWTESLAGRLLTRLREAGIGVPTQLSVIGFDSTLYCETTEPRLTAVRQPIQQMAAFAATTLLEILDGQDASSLLTTFPCTLDTRGSTARAVS